MKLVMGLLFALSLMSNASANTETAQPAAATEEGQLAAGEATEAAPAVADTTNPTATEGKDGANVKISCTQNKVERTIEVVYKASPAKVPCDVIYTKESGDAKPIYSANAKTGYCEEMAEEHKKKLVSMNWVCKNL